MVVRIKGCAPGDLLLSTTTPPWSWFGKSTAARPRAAGQVQAAVRQMRRSIDSNVSRRIRFWWKQPGAKDHEQECYMLFVPDQYDPWIRWCRMRTGTDISVGYGPNQNFLRASSTPERLSTRSSGVGFDSATSTSRDVQHCTRASGSSGSNVRTGLASST